jgi:hypothetical protein
VDDGQGAAALTGTPLQRRARHCLPGGVCRLRSAEAAMQEPNCRQIEQVLNQKPSREQLVEVGVDTQDLEGGAAEVKKVLIDIDRFELKVLAPPIGKHGLNGSGFIDG